MRQLLELLKAIAGNDEVKIAIVNAGGIRTILGAMSRYVQVPQVREKQSGSEIWIHACQSPRLFPCLQMLPICVATVNVQVHSVYVYIIKNIKSCIRRCTCNCRFTPKIKQDLTVGLSGLVFGF